MHGLMLCFHRALSTSKCRFGGHHSLQLFKFPWNSYSYITATLRNKLRIYTTIHASLVILFIRYIRGFIKILYKHRGGTNGLKKGRGSKLVKRDIGMLPLDAEREFIFLPIFSLWNSVREDYNDANLGQNIVNLITIDLIIYHLSLNSKQRIYFPINKTQIKLMLLN